MVRATLALHSRYQYTDELDNLRILVGLDFAIIIVLILALSDPLNLSLPLRLGSLHLLLDGLILCRVECGRVVFAVLP
jgi:hypothetical protein